MTRSACWIPTNGSESVRSAWSSGERRERVSLNLCEEWILSGAKYPENEISNRVTVRWDQISVLNSHERNQVGSRVGFRYPSSRASSPTVSRTGNWPTAVRACSLAADYSTNCNYAHTVMRRLLCTDVQWLRSVPTVVSCVVTIWILTSTGASVCGSIAATSRSDRAGSRSVSGPVMVTTTVSIDRSG